MRNLTSWAQIQHAGWNAQMLVPQAKVPGKRGATEILHAISFFPYYMQRLSKHYIPQVDGDKRADTTLKRSTW